MPAIHKGSNSSTNLKSAVPPNHETMIEDAFLKDEPRHDEEDTRVDNIPTDETPARLHDMTWFMMKTVARIKKRSRRKASPAYS